jgi:hypothetical protein
MAYASISQLRAVLTSGGNTLPTTDDALLIMYLEDAQQLIDDFTHRTFEASATSTKTFDAIADVRTLDTLGVRTIGGTERTLWLGGYDLAAAPTSIVNGDGATVSAADYVLEPRNEAPYHAITLKSGSSVTWTYDDSPENARRAHTRRHTRLGRVVLPAAQHERRHGSAAAHRRRCNHPAERAAEERV